MCLFSPRRLTSLPKVSNSHIVGLTSFRPGPGSRNRLPGVEREPMSVLPVEELRQFCRRQPIQEMWVFGSVLNDWQPDSDVSPKPTAYCIPKVPWSRLQRMLYRSTRQHRSP